MNSAPISVCQSPTVVKRTSAKPLPALSLLNELFELRTESGELIRRKQRGGTAAPGSIAGGIVGNGYQYVVIDCQHYLVHRIIWKMEHGIDPPMRVDHKDRNPLNNRITNLRLATQSQNLANSKMLRNNTSGIRGVILDKRSGKWLARMSVMNRSKHIGSFATPEEAKAAYQNAAIALHGEFARTA
jgi:hypothetical protein